MSSARKRAAIQKANAESEHLRMKVSMLERHYATMKCMAESIGVEVDAWRRRFPEHEYRRQDDCVALKL